MTDMHFKDDIDNLADRRVRTSISHQQLTASISTQKMHHICFPTVLKLEKSNVRNFKYFGAIYMKNQNQNYLLDIPEHGSNHKAQDIVFTLKIMFLHA